MELNKANKILETDVLVLGSGAAGCCAAVAARRQGAKVMLVDKGKLEGSGSICGGNDHFMANLNTGPEWDTDQAVVNSMKRAHEGLTATQIDRGWVKNMPAVIQLLEDSGLQFARNTDGTYVRTTGFAQPGPWWMNIQNGWFIKKMLAKKIRGMGIDCVDNIMITRLLTSKGRIAGAAGFNILTGDFYVLKGKTVVLALGREANRAGNNSTGMPFNTWGLPYNTGSNTVLAYEAGAKVQNLELNEMATLLPKGFGCPGMNGMNSMGGHELNALGERFMGKYDPKNWENTVRRIQVAATYQELIAGKGPPFYMDMRHLSKEDNDFLQDVLMQGDKATFLDYIKQKGVAFATHPLEVECSEIHLGGRLLIDEKFESTIPGMFSGCNFHFLSGSMCGGYAAGIEAAKQAGTMGKNEPDQKEIAAEKEIVYSPLAKKDGLKPKEFEHVIRQVMTYYMGYSRNAQGIQAAKEKLALISSHDIKADNLHDLMRALEAKHLLKHCQLSAIACAERKESGRTIYVRSDYPNPDPALDKCLVLWQEKGQMQMAFGAPI
jgi:succinate dehydrogenase/fumarate reductase flavoprotein subunit